MFHLFKNKLLCPFSPQESWNNSIKMYIEIVHSSPVDSAAKLIFVWYISPRLLYISCCQANKHTDDKRIEYTLLVISGYRLQRKSIFESVGRFHFFPLINFVALTQKSVQGDATVAQTADRLIRIPPFLYYLSV